MVLQPRQLRDRTSQRHGAHFQPADIVDPVTGERVERQFCEQRRALGVEHGRLEVEVEIAFAARGERDLAAPEGALADDVGEAGAGVGGRGHRACSGFWGGRKFIPPAGAADKVFEHSPEKSALVFRRKCDQAKLMRLVPVVRSPRIDMERHRQHRRREGRLLHDMGNHGKRFGDFLLGHLEDQFVMDLEQHLRP